MCSKFIHREPVTTAHDSLLGVATHFFSREKLRKRKQTPGLWFHGGALLQLPSEGGTVGNFKVNFVTRHFHYGLQIRCSWGFNSKFDLTFILRNRHLDYGLQVVGKEVLLNKTKAVNSGKYKWVYPECSADQVSTSLEYFFEKVL